MSVGAALRKAINTFGGAGDEYDDYNEYDDSLETQAYEVAGPRHLSLVEVPRQTIEVVAPQEFDDVKALADRFRSGSSVFVNTAACDAELTKRIVDFCGGLACALDGSLERVDGNVFLLTPAHTDLLGGEGVLPRGFYNQL